MPRTGSYRLQTNASTRTCIRRLTQPRRTHCPAGATPPAPRNTFLSSRACTLRWRAPSLVKNTTTSSPAAYQRQATCLAKLRPVGPHAYIRGEPRIVEPRPRRPPSKCRPLTDRGSDTGATLNGAVAPLSPNDRASCNQARPVADITVPKLLQPKRVWPADPRNARGLASPEPSRSRAIDPRRIRAGCRFHACHDRRRSSSGAPRVGAARHDLHRDAQTATRLVD